MTRKKSVKKYIQVGSVIKTGVSKFWEVTALFPNYFQCVLIGDEDDWVQEFYYNIDMVVFGETARNI